jgi:hypothetical protein
VSLVAHGAPMSGHEPTMEHYFFERVRPIVEQALKRGNHGDWPLITLNLDFKTEEPAHLAAVWELLAKYHDWLTTAPKGADAAVAQALTVRPILVLTGESNAQQSVFYDRVPVGGELLLFGAVHTHMQDPMATPEVLEPLPATNYRRWWNNPWNVVEKGGQPHAGAWTQADNERLQQLVRHAHDHGLWIRFYTLDGAIDKEESCNGWFRSYNFGTLAVGEPLSGTALTTWPATSMSCLAPCCGSLVPRSRLCRVAIPRLRPHLPQIDRSLTEARDNFTEK